MKKREREMHEKIQEKQKELAKKKRKEREENEQENKRKKKQKQHAKPPPQPTLWVPKRGVRIQVSPSTKPARGHPKGPLGTTEPHLSGPILTCICPERQKSLFWPPDARAPQ